ncbi:MAG: ATP-binding protein [Okeania sp. SIO2G4]|uniref:ATP-binding protein n=1 Tax=unclassified Okeania TaxID=2634635 RepID=UPI0013BBF5CF|nr:MULTISPECIES: ATP-binding protein [unclassified Okeania]NEP39071.1 ATP-binding protein [Okeania sp. SIO2H7]NEP71565.1 ATP-binding protein [Okeania sp. SIO2G5]NEP92537.1 ATP-binding protein [Okeania sp. SIO2F5]NEQ92090.1 ATP-binding protein [Okeania sp. SIO2G4]
MSCLGSQVLAKIQNLQQQIASLLLYQSVLKKTVGEAFIQLLESLSKNDGVAIECLQAYGNWFRNIASQNISWQEYLIAQIIQDDNPFSQQVQKINITSLSPNLIAAAKHDLQILQNLYQCSGKTISQWVKTIAKLENPPIAWEIQSQQKEAIYDELKKLENWADAIETLATHYHHNGTGLFAESIAFEWRNGQLLTITYPDPVELKELVGYEFQKDTLIKNTQFLLAGYSALNVLLYGSRGSGKSSLIKALLNEYSQRNLRLVEVAKSDLKDLPLIAEKLRDIPQKFIIFVDDLSFEEDDDTFKALKVVLEGNLTARPTNVVVYATSNRRHLIREFFNDRPRPKDSDEVHNWDTVQEKLSFSDRFGLTLTFEPANQDTYLTIVRHLAKQAKINLNPEDLDYQALQWATKYNGRSGRTARQFIDFLKANLAVFEKY